jgi:hypothetical protein
VCDIQDLKALGKDLTKEDHIIIVRENQVASNLHRNLNYKTKTDLKNTAKNSMNTNIRFGSLLEHQNKSKMDMRLRGYKS